MFLNSISAGAGRIILPEPVIALIEPDGDLWKVLDYGLGLIWVNFP